jgi:hypothetical protein
MSELLGVGGFILDIKGETNEIGISDLQIFCIHDGRSE